MAGKRQATSDLNHDNWDREDEPEERGTFKTADEQELKNRVIKKAARRRVAGTTDSADSGTKSVFSGFSGFGKPAAAATTSSTGASPFSFLSKISSATPASSSSSTATSEATKPAATTFSFGSSATTTTTTDSAKEDKSDAKTTEKSSDEYYAKLKGLNQAVSEWIKTHVDKNPLCILTPIFKDYEKYLAEIEEEKKKGGDKSSSSSTTSDEKKTSSTAGIGTFKFSETSTAKSSTATTTPLFSFSSSATTTSTAGDTAATKTNGFSFGLKKPEDTTDAKTTTPAATTGFSFGLKASTTSSSSTTTTSTTAAAPSFTFGKPASASDSGDAAPKPFSFTPGGTPFSFGNIKPPEAAAPSKTENDEEDEEPPKNEFKQVVEEDAVYSKKCKVFVKKDGNFADKGVGTLYLKPIESSEKTQLIVRADTNLGNILVNLILSSAIPAQRMGKNNVMMVCIPTPEVEKPTPMLLRVKTGEEADELLATIEKYKK
ncbi:nuclear pore complex protein Nup50 [Musca vetustissima]|uniref:nuclear pore complex protein Nup50 n=1 Tax=Musca vetustissima TaxID=27455 RepID=UPI002AB64DD8|nr:nuclear pore complex protein Nup50 [Musca vetustissima]